MTSALLKIFPTNPNRFSLHPSVSESIIDGLALADGRITAEVGRNSLCVPSASPARELNAAPLSISGSSRPIRPLAVQWWRRKPRPVPRLVCRRRFVTHAKCAILSFAFQFRLLTSPSCCWRCRRQFLSRWSHVPIDWSKEKKPGVFDSAHQY